MSDKKEKIENLKEFLKAERSVLLGFVFGSRANGRARTFSDWDVAIYFKPYKYAELDSMADYPDEHRVWGEIERILETSEVDFIVLNRAKPSLVFTVLNSGLPLVLKDKKLFLELLIKSHYEAVDYWNFTREFSMIAKKASSISEEGMAILRRHISFLESEFQDLGELKNLSMEEYLQDRNKRRNVERWVENLVMSAIDISKIVLASEKREIPQTYRDSLLLFCIRFMGEDTASRFSQFAEMRNILAHEYLDMRWERIKNFIKDASSLYPIFIENVRKIVQ